MVIVVGAGPAGLATAYYLKQKNIPYLVLEKESVGYAWQNHYDSLALHTLKEVSALPGRPIPENSPPFLGRQQFLDYLLDYAQHFQLNIIEGVEVTNAIYHGYHGEWHIATNRGEYTAELLIVATGIWSTPHRPHFPDEERFSGTILHARDYQKAEPFTGQSVLVVGAGNSGAEIAVELAGTAAQSAILVRDGTAFVAYPNSVQAVKVGAWFFGTLPHWLGSAILSRTRRNFAHLDLPWPDKPLTKAYPVVGYELPEAIAAGQVTVYHTSIARFTAEGVVFGDGRTAAFDTVILATGYRPTLQFVARELTFDNKGWPLLKHGQSLKNERLYCVGFNYPTTEGWLQALPRVAKQAVDHLAPKLKDVQKIQTSITK